MKIYVILLLLISTCLKTVFAQENQSLIYYDKAKNLIIVCDSAKNLIIKICYKEGCFIDFISVMGKQVVNASSGVSTGFVINGKNYTSVHSQKKISIDLNHNKLNIGGISFGEKDFCTDEDWIFIVRKNSIQWTINRSYPNNRTLEENYFPLWTFSNMQTWDGAMLDNGGVAWCRFLEKENYTYGAHASAMTLWNRSNNICLSIKPVFDTNLYPALSFSHIENNLFAVNETYSSKPVNTKNGLKRFIQTGKDVFAPIAVTKSNTNITYTLQALSYDQAYDRGTLKGINESSVNEILNTIARYSVVDQNLFGSNGWRTGWAVLQEQWLALFSLAIDDSDYIRGFSQTLEYERSCYFTQWKGSSSLAP